MAWGYKVGQEWSKDSWYEGVYIDGKTPEEIEKIKEQIENEKEIEQIKENNKLEEER